MMTELPLSRDSRVVHAMDGSLAAAAFVQGHAVFDKAMDRL
jgi:hypothetical protein